MSEFLNSIIQRALHIRLHNFLSLIFVEHFDIPLQLSGPNVLQTIVLADLTMKLVVLILKLHRKKRERRRISKGIKTWFGHNTGPKMV